MLCKILWRIQTKANHDAVHITKKIPFTPVWLKEWNRFTRTVSLAIRRIKGLIDDGRVKLRKVQVEP